MSYNSFDTAVTSAMMQHLLPLAAILLLSIIPAETEVVASVEHCNKFFLQQTPPHIPGILEGRIIQDRTRYKWICQTLHNNRTFVTLYDTKNKIPVFSAAKYKREGGGRRPRTEWMIEPQLEDMGDKPNMRKSKVKITYKHQAGFQDYKNNQGFDKGHLFPSSYASTDIGKRSTFTLTNIVPQNKYFNSGRWNKMENCVKCILDEYCNSKGFVIIGAQPSGNSLNRKINIPSVLWSAFCCYSEKQGSWLASAHWGENVDDRPKNLKTMNLGKLKRTLRIEPFPETQCPPDTTVTHLYSDLPSNCNC
uniref:Uncharacterized protein n=1 Tax=Oreochromis niloticus TaxID=8128 RepID=A0A669E3D3_ORENI